MADALQQPQSMPQKLDKHEVRRSFSHAAKSYDAHAVLQQEVASRLLERVAFHRYPPKTILDLGCGTGQHSAYLKKAYRKAQVIALDSATGMLKHSKKYSSFMRPLSPVCADLCALPLPDRSVDLIFSNLAIQWVNRLPAAFTEFRRVLRPEGLLLFTTFGPDTLHELKSAWAAADQGIHVNQFVDMHDIGDALVYAGFAEPVMDTDYISLTYKDVPTLMRELKLIGAHNAAANRQTGLMGKHRYQAMLEAYQSFQKDGLYPATYEVIYGTAFGPAEGQPRRTPEGEVATFSLQALRQTTKKPTTNQ